jgi:hypothetical protein
MREKIVHSRKKRSHLDDLGVDEKIILKQVLNKKDSRIWTGLVAQNKDRCQTLAIMIKKHPRHIKYWKLPGYPGNC